MKDIPGGYERIQPSFDISLNGCNYPLKGKKSSLSEGGVRIPLVLTSTKRTLKPKKTLLNHSIDWFATILDLAQAEIPENIDGKSLAHTITNPSQSDKDSKVRDRLIIGVFHNFQKTSKSEFSYVFEYFNSV